MAHLKKQMGLLAKYLLSDKTEIVKAMEYQGTVSTGVDAEENYVSNQGVSKAIAKGTKVGLSMKSLIINIGIRDTGETIMTGVVSMFLLEVGMLHLLVMARCPWMK